MGKPHRIAAGGIIFRDDAVLLVRYRDGEGGTFLVGPGGALMDDENVVQAIVRETMEETNVRVQPKRVVAIEDLVSSTTKMCKVWMVCDVVEGDVAGTEEALKEGIIGVGWYTRAQLAGEVVYPPPLMEYDWDELRSENWRVVCPASRRAEF